MDNNNDLVKNSFDDTFSINLVKTNARNTNRMNNPYGYICSKTYKVTHL